jgi:hypothetical protein
MSAHSSSTYRSRGIFRRGPARTAIGAGAVLLALSGAAALAGSARADDGSGVALALGSGGWAYQQVAHGDGNGFERPEFSTEGWSVGTAGFGSGSLCPFNNSTQVRTSWDLDTDLLLRHPLDIPPTATSARITGTIDNIADVYVNGQLLQHVESGSCQTGTIDAEVPVEDLHSGDVLAVRASDYGGASFVDVQVTYDSTPTSTPTPTGSSTPTPSDSPSGPPAPAELTGGVFNGLLPGEDAVVPKKSTGDNTFACTTGFAVAKGEDRYLLTADHCREWLSRKGKGLGVFASPVDVIGYSEDEGDVTWASGLDCDGGDARCLRPTDPDAAADVLAWAPDEGTVTPVAKVVTGSGVLPVLGASGWNKGQTVCHLVYESDEVCGRVGGFDSSTGYAWIKEPGDTASEIDAGGPVYSYVLNSDGVITGVRAVGILEASSRTLTHFYPIAAVKAALGVQLLTAQE